MFKGQISKEFLLLCSVAFYLLAFQINFFIPKFLWACYLVAFFCAVFGLAKFEIERGWFKYLTIFLIFFILALISFFFGSIGDYKPRRLFANFLSIVFMICVASILNRDVEARRRTLDIVLFALWAEIGIFLLQFSFLTWGVGIVPKNEDAEFTGFLTGSFGNLNNVAVIIVLQLLLLIAKNRVIRNWSGYLIVFAVGFAVFLTLSRTVLVFYVTLFLYFGFKGRQLSEKGGVRLGFLALLISFGAALTVIDSVGEANNVVIERSFNKIFSLGSLEQDYSVKFRVISMDRVVSALDRLGVGTMSDLNYGIFFNQDDDSLAKVNPHSLLAEIAFLYGWLGLGLIVIFFVFSFIDILRSSKNLVLSLYFFSSFLLFQAVPSSVLGMPVFFYFIILVSKFDSVRGTQRHY